MRQRPAFTIVEMTFVLSVLGIVATLAVPRLREIVERGEAAALHERVYSVRLAYEATDGPAPERLRRPPGELPPQFATALNPDHFIGEGDVLLSVVGQGNIVFVRLGGSTPRAARVRQAFHQLARMPHLYSNQVVLVPISGTALSAIAVSKPPTMGQPPTTGQTPTTVQPPATVQPPTVTQPAVGATTGTPTPIGTPTSAPTCAASLPPGQYRQCLSGSTHGNSGNAHHGGWFRQ